MMTGIENGCAWAEIDHSHAEIEDGDVAFRQDGEES